MWTREELQKIGDICLRHFLTQRLPQIRLVEPEGCYFAWLDCSGLGLSRRELNDLVVNKAKLWLDAGHIFGACAEQFQRVVLACPRSTLQEALERLERAVNSSLHQYNNETYGISDLISLFSQRDKNGKIEASKTGVLKEL